MDKTYLLDNLVSNEKISTFYRDDLGARIKRLTEDLKAEITTEPARVKSIRIKYDGTTDQLDYEIEVGNLTFSWEV